MASPERRADRDHHQIEEQQRQAAMEPEDLIALLNNQQRYNRERLANMTEEERAAYEGDERVRLQNYRARRTRVEFEAVQETNRNQRIMQPVTDRDETDQQDEYQQQLPEQESCSERNRFRRRAKRRGEALHHHDSFGPEMVKGKNVIDGRHRVPMKSACAFCKAWKIDGESSAKCCVGGKVRLEPFSEPPAQLMQHFHDPDFRRQIRAYNNVFAFTPLGASPTEGLNVDMDVAGNHGVYTFRVQGALCHRLGSLLPPSGSKPLYAQIYIADADMDARVQLRLGMTAGLNVSILTDIENVMQEHNKFVREFLTAGEIIRMKQRAAREEQQQRQRVRREQEGKQEEDVHGEPDATSNISLALQLHARPGDDSRTFNRPTISEVAAVLVDDGNSDKPRDLILHARNDSRMVHVFETRAEYDPLQYPLLLPRGEVGWSPKTRYYGGATGRGKEFMALREFVAFRLYPKVDDHSLIHWGGRLFQQYVVDQWAKAEQTRLQYHRSNERQRRYRRETFRGLQDALRSEDVSVLCDEDSATIPDPSTASNIGSRVVLPSTFTGGPRYMYQQYQDAMAIVREFGKPDLFITTTCNPNWPEIKENIFPHQTAQDRPDVVSRVWQQKLHALLNDLDEGVLGVQVARIYVIEFQKRGLPHAHILVILHEVDKPRTATYYNKFVSAELPDPDRNPLLYETIITSMMHGPCGEAHPRSPCMKDGKCSKKFSKRFAEETRTNSDGYPVYMRRSRPEGELKHGSKTWDNKTVNQWVVPYNPYLTQKYNCHLNVEVCSTIKAVKYIYKYVYKGSDKATITIGGHRRGNQAEEEPGEIKRYVQTRYISPVEACQRLFDWPVQAKTHSVVYLTVYRKGESLVTFNQDNEHLGEEMAVGEATTLTAYFKLCAADPSARTMLYQDIPKKYRYNKDTSTWIPYVRYVSSIGRMVHCSPQQIERFYLRLLLCHRRGPTSFKDLRKVNDVQYSTYKDAALVAGLLEDDNEWKTCMSEAATFKMPRQLRLLFVTIIVYSLPSDIKGLWDASFDDMSRDYQYQCDAGPGDRMVQFRTLKSVNSLLQANSKSLEDFSSLPSLPDYPDEIREELTVNSLIRQERSYSRDVLERILAVTHETPMNTNQQYVFDQVIGAIQQPEAGKRLFFIDGPGGTGKSFLLEQILATLRAEGKIAIAVASSGIAAALLTGGRTAHSVFKIPLQVTNESMCAISKQSHLAELIRQASLIIWDEAPMTHRFSYEALDRTLRDLMRNDSEPFGGKVMVLSGDFRQILPVVKRAGITETIDACLKSSGLWQHFEQLRLIDNMRVRTAPDQQTSEELAAFSSFLLQVGEGRHEKNPALGSEFIEIPQDMLINEPEEEPVPSFRVLPSDDAADQDGNNSDDDDDEDEVPFEEPSELSKIVESVYGDLNSHSGSDSYFAERAILTPTNSDVHRINDEVTKKLTGEAQEYLSVDTVHEGDDDMEGLYETEYLNSLSISGIPPHKLTLKVGSPIMMMRNLNSDLGLCNGTRLRVVELTSNCIRASIMTGARKGQQVFIPRIVLISNEGEYPFQLRRKQFPVVPAFSMTINKAQGQSIHHLGLYLPTPVFAHGQLYVALSRVTSRSSIKVVVLRPELEEHDGVYTKNVVYRQIFEN